jgi:hypothetical protein
MPLSCVVRAPSKHVGPLRGGEQERKCSAGGHGFGHANVVFDRAVDTARTPQASESDRVAGSQVRGSDDRGEVRVGRSIK